MLVIGLVGGVASGKSFVAQCFSELRAVVLDADKIGHEVLDRAAVIAEIQALWPDVRLVDGKIDRSSLAKIVFSSATDDRQLKKLESVLHPLIGQQIELRLNRLAELQSVAAVLDAPVMFKAGWDKRCDKIVFVDAEWSVRQERAQSRGWSSDEIVRRERFQLPIDQKRLKSTDIVDNSNSRSETVAQVQRLWKQWEIE
jgi:dephospho-CoA kinase